MELFIRLWVGLNLAEGASNTVGWSGHSYDETASCWVGGNSCARGGLFLCGQVRFIAGLPERQCLGGLAPERDCFGGCSAGRLSALARHSSWGLPGQYHDAGV